MNLIKLEQFLKENKQPAFRLKQIKKAVFDDAVISFDEMTVLPKDLRSALILRQAQDADFRILPFSAKNILASKDKDSYKALLELEDGRVIETVLLNMKEGSWSVCVSSQAGCAMKCSFCATGAAGFFRNLTSEEIWGQVLFWRRFNFENSKRLNLPNFRISSVVYMGMGEPFNNIDNVFESLKVLTDKDMMGIGQRNISVSTCGIVPGIEEFSKEFPQINLAISLHAATDELREKMMPVNKAYNLGALAEGLRKYFENSNRQVFIEYILLKDINDGEDDARDLVKYLFDIGNRHLLHVNLIVFNPPRRTSSQVPESILQPSSRNQAEKFKNYLVDNGFDATIRKSLGQDIEGACGQLAGK